MLTLAEVLPHFDGKKALLAEHLGISRQAVSRWQPESPIPEKHELKLRHQLIGWGEISSKESTKPRLTDHFHTSSKLRVTRISELVYYFC